LGGFVVEFAGNVHYFFAWTTLWLERSGATRGGDFSRKSYDTSMVSDAVGNAGSSYSENLGLEKEEGAS
jgi:hypothetical protein